MRKVGAKLFLTLLCLVLLRASALAGEVYLSVAASLKDVINELSDSFAKQNVGIKFLKNYGGSGALARQIENGAPADIFISANLEWMDYLQNKRLMDSASIGIFTYNTLVFVGAADKKVSAPAGSAQAGEDRHRQPEECSCRAVCPGGPQKGRDRQTTGKEVGHGQGRPRMSDVC